MSRRAVECECREVVIVPDGASEETKCPCGRRVVIPLDEEFETGEVVISAATVERRIQRLHALERLPPTRECAWCGSRRADPLDVRLICERVSVRNTGGFRFLIIPGLFSLYWWEAERIEFLGRENTVEAPVCACSACARALNTPARTAWGTIGGAVGVIALATALLCFVPLVSLIGGPVLLLGIWALHVRRKERAWAQRQHEFKAILAEVPSYAQLLRAYPDAVVVLPPWKWVDRTPRGRSPGPNDY